MSSEDLIYRELQKKIHAITPAGFPASEDGTDIQILKMLITPEDANIAIHLGRFPEPLTKIHGRLTKSDISISLNELEDILDGLANNGVIRRGPKLPDGRKDEKSYAMTQWLVGMFELQLGRMTKEFAELANKYNHETFYKVMHRKDIPPQLHTIPVEKSLTPEHYVSTYDSVRDIINNQVNKIAIGECICRAEHDLLDDPCKASDIRSCCVTFTSGAESSNTNGTGKELSKEEFFALLDTYQKEGFVLQPQNIQNPGFICVCCGCCCAVLTMAKQFPRPAEYYFSNFYAQSDLELCNGCETCLERCQMDAITMVDDRATVDLDRCIGCGNCVATCEADAMQLFKRDEEIVPPKDVVDLYQKIIEKK